MIQYFHMAYQYNDAGLTYNSSKSSYNGDQLIFDVDVFDVIQISEDLAFTQTSGVMTVNVYDTLQTSESLPLFILELFIVAPEPTFAGIFAHYKWNDNAADQVVADNIGGFNGTWAAGTTAGSTTTGKINEALLFGGVSDYMRVTDADTFDLSTFSYAAWLQNPTGGVFNQVILSKKPIPGDTDGYELSLSFDGVNYILTVASGVSSATFNTGVDWAAGNWHQIVVIFDGITVYAYCDNISLGSEAINSVAANSHDLLFGKTESLAIDLWSGKMDDTRFYNRVITTDEINLLWNNGNGTEIDYEYIAISEDVEVSMKWLPRVNDRIEISEVVTITNPTLGGINVNSTINLSETVLVDAQYNISVIDTLNISENFAGERIIYIQVYETVNLSESVNVANPELFGTTSDTINISESVSAGLVHTLSVNDTINISENFRDSGQLQLSVSDRLNLSESIIVTESDLGGINVNDVIEISEVIDATNILAGINVNSTINLSENVSLGISISEINVYDLINLSENFRDAGLSTVSVNDSIDISEDLNLTLVYNVHGVESITITETITMESFRFSPSDGRPVGRINTMNPVANLSGYA